MGIKKNHTNELKAKGVMAAMREAARTVKSQM